MFKKVILLLLLSCMIVVANPLVFAAEKNLLQNSGFETGTNGPGNWEKKMWFTNDISEFKWETGAAHSGNKFVTIINKAPNHARYAQEVSVKPNKLYKIACWIKAEKIPTDKKGAGLGIEGVALGDFSLRDTGGKWQSFEIYGATGSTQVSLSLYLTLGGYGSLNLGQASFDDVSFEEVDRVPPGVQLYKFYQDTSAAPVVATNTQPTNSDLFNRLTAEHWILLAILVLVIYIPFAVYFLLYYKPKNALPSKLPSQALKSKTTKNKPKANPKIKAQPELKPQIPGVVEPKYLNYLYLIIGLGILFRLIIAPIYKGYYFDYRMFKYWSESAVNGLFSIYHPGKVYIDYPPVYILVLYVVGLINKIFGVVPDSGLYITMLKLPAILADAATAYILFTIAKTRLDINKCLLIAALYIFNPAIWFDTVLWGQVDSVFFLLIIAMFLAITQERLELAAVFLAVSILMKPQGFMFAPVLLFELLKRKNFMTFLTATLSGLITAFVIIIPFTVNNSNPLWLWDLLFKMTGTWKFASINAFNFFALVGANWKEDYHTFFLFTYETWGNLFILLTVLFTVYIYWKSKKPYTVFFGALILNMGAFNLSSRMHERYLYPAMIIALLIYIFLKERRALYIFIGTSITNFLNIFLSFIGVASSSNVEAYAALCRVPANHPLLLITSLLNVIMLIYVVKFTIDVTLKENGNLAPVARGVNQGVRARAGKG
jgi:dolichyl-phosphate-mannose-protein mannosyltransferase